MQAVDDTLLQFRDAACDELAMAINLSAVEAKRRDDELRDRTLSSSLQVAGEKISGKLLDAVVVKRFV